MRLNRFLSQAGIASRRAAEKIILSGKLTVNGVVVWELGTQVDPLSDKVCYQGKPISLGESHLYYLIYKPKHVMVTKKDPEKRKTVYQLIPQLHPSVNAVGRLDFDSEGLLILTNDGELAFCLTHPSYEVEKVYQVYLDRLPDEKQRFQLEKGILIEGEKTSPAKIEILSESKKMVSIEIHEGKKRQVRKMFESAGCKVQRLIRVQFSFLKLGNMSSGKWRTLSKGEILKLKEVMGNKKPHSSCGVF